MSRLLILDADATSRAAITIRMNDCGHEALGAPSIQEGLQLSSGQPFEALLVCADPSRDPDGVETCRLAKTSPTLGGLPVVLYTDREVAPHFVDRAYEAGCDFFLGRQQVMSLERVLGVVLRIKGRLDGLSEENRALEAKNRDLEVERQRSEDIQTVSSDGGSDSLVLREISAARPDGVLLVDHKGLVLRGDRGARDLLGTDIEGRNLGSLVPSSGLEAFVRDARIEARDGFRFETPERKDRSQRSLMASVMPVTQGAAADGERVLLLVDLGKRRVARELSKSNEPATTRYQLNTLLEAARIVFSPENIRGQSDAARRLRHSVIDACKGTGPVLLRGARGTGKEHLGRTLHYTAMCPGPLMQLRCTALTEESLENELFGYVAGAFPGALTDRPGMLALAREGTLFLTEVGDLPPGLQKKLSEAISSGEIRRRGSDASEPIAVRIIATTSSNLDKRVRSGRFLRELYSQLRQTAIDVPSLHERIYDLPNLVEQFLLRFASREVIQGIEPRALRTMMRYEWPGNGMELEDCIEQACARAQGPHIGVQHLTKPLRDLYARLPEEAFDEDALDALETLPGEAPSSLAQLLGSPFAIATTSRPWDITDADPISLDVYERKVLLRALDTCGGDRLAAARLLNVGKSTLYRKLKRFEIQ